MSSYSLNIAGYTILFTAADPSLTLQPGEPQLSFLTTQPHHLVINVSRGKPFLPRSATPVFRAPYVEERETERKVISNTFWTVYTTGKNIILKTILPLMEPAGTAILTLTPGAKSWDLTIESNNKTLNPLSYPLDGLILYYLAALNGDLFIHGAGVYFGSRGYLFTGRSGYGKTTIANLFKEAGGEVVHDDRLIIRQSGEQYRIYNTPVYNNEVSSFAPLDSIFLISHGTDNISVRVSKAEALALVMSNCIQHNWSVKLIGNLTGALHKLVNEVEVNRLSFAPTSDVVRYISDNG